MALTDTIKRAPRWAWVTVAGVGTGALALKVWKGRAQPTPTAEADAYGSETGYTGGAQVSNPSAVIVPPVMFPSGGTDPNQGVGLLQDLYIGATGNLIDRYESLTSGIITAYEQVWGPVQTAQLGLLTSNSETIASLAQAGSAPSAMAPPQETVAFLPPPAPAPTPLPAPAPAAPASPCGDCKSPYPYCNEAKKACYTVVCASGKGDKRKGKWHVYKNPALDTYMGAQC